MWVFIKYSILVILIFHYFTEFTFAAVVTQKEPIANTTVYILSYFSFLFDTDSFSFNVFKRLYYTIFKLNVVNLSRALPPLVPH